jgi:hypothetical protein
MAERQTLAISRDRDDYMHITPIPLALTFQMMEARATDPWAGIARCRSVRPQPLCSCGYYWLTWW